MAEIRNLGGRPAIFIDGKPYPPMMATVRTIDKSDIHFDRDYFVQLGRAGIRIFFVICDTVWLKPDAVELFDTEARALLDAVPDAYIVPRIGMHPTNEWIAAHPEECVTYSNGDRPAVHLFSESYETDLPAHYSLCSSKWREDAGKALAETWSILMSLPYADRIIGCFLAAGGTSEWYYMLPPTRDGNRTVAGHDAAFRRNFSKYLTEQYGTDEALAKAWKAPDATLADPLIPDYERFYFVGRVDHDLAIPPHKMYTNKPLPPPPGNGETVGCFTDMDKSRDAFDFCRAWHLGSADSVLHFAKIIKELTPDRLVGAFYGAQGCTDLIRSGTCGGTRRILDSPYVDFLAAPGVYENRQPGGFEGQRTVQDSFYLHNKIYIVEQDTRTLAENRYFMNKARIFDMTDTLNVMKREFGRDICEDVQAWWFDQLLGGRRYKYPEVYALMARQQEIAREAYSLDRRKRSEIALIYDEESLQAVSVKSSRDTIEMFRNYELGFVGAPVDQYYHNDMADPNMPSYKLYIFMNVWLTTEEERRVIREKLRRDGAVAVWLYAPGFVDPEADVKMSVAHMEALTGIKMARIDEQFDGAFRWNGEPHPICEGLDRRQVLGHFEHRRKMMLMPSETVMWEAALYPMFYADDPDAVTVASFLTSGYPAVSVKKCDGFTSVHFGAKIITAETVRAIARFAGCHIFCETRDVIFAGRNYITFHASESGQKTIRLPRPARVEEVYENKIYAEAATEFTFDAYLGETKMFRVVEIDG